MGSTGNDRQPMRRNPMPFDYGTVTEIPGIGATREQLGRLNHRYEVASRYCRDRRVLEVACGAGLGLGYLAQTASRVVGGDYTGDLVRMAKDHYRGRIGLLRLDAHALPFQDASFDTVVLLEALYYLGEPDQFLQECRRLLSKDGVVVICTVNKDWSDFNPSPFSVKYYSAPELFALLERHGFKTELFGAFSATTDSLPQKAVSLIKRTAAFLHLIPRSMKGKEWLKRLFYGELSLLPDELEGVGVDQASLVPVSNDVPTSQYKELYAVGHLQ